jgi:uncharacterized protein (DUF924 family)
MYEEILNFWFEEIDQSLWWSKDDEFDQLVIEKYSDIHAAAAQCELFEWRITARGRLAEIIILDQFSRNMFRESASSFAYDSLALVLAQEAVSGGADQELLPVQRSFLYMPYMHSESLALHKLAVDLYHENGIQSSYEFEMKHIKIIETFGRYPHRNRILGRDSSQQEIEFLKQPDSGF